MKVLFASAEAAPFAKVGGLADVVGSLPQALRRQGTDARVIMPYYGFIDADKYQITPYFQFQLTRPTGTTDVGVFTALSDGVPIYFVKGWPFFGDEAEVYTNPEIDVPRFLFFNQAALAVAWELLMRYDWFPDVWHVNDWHTGLIPFLLADNRQQPGSSPAWKNVGSLLSIHNIGYQGDHVGGWLWELGIPGRHQPDLLYQDLTDNMLAIVNCLFRHYNHRQPTLCHRNSISVHHPPWLGWVGTHPHRRPVTASSTASTWNSGIQKPTPNWYPTTTPKTSLKNVRPIKRQLQTESGLEVRDDIPIVGIVSRLVWQKGFDLAMPALRRLLVGTDVQFVVLGSGEPELDYEFWRLGRGFLLAGESLSGL